MSRHLTTLMHLGPPDIEMWAVAVDFRVLATDIAGPLSGRHSTA